MQELVDGENLVREDYYGVNATTGLSNGLMETLLTSSCARLSLLSFTLTLKKFCLRSSPDS